MPFANADAANLETTVLNIVETVLKAGFAAPEVAALFARFGGVVITRRPEQGFEWFTKSKRPFLFLQFDGDEQHGWQFPPDVPGGPVKQGTRHEITLGVEAICAAPCADAERPLRDALRSILEGAYFTLGAAGLEGAKVRVLRPEEHPDRRNPIALTLAVYTV